MENMDEKGYLFERKETLIQSERGNLSYLEWGILSILIGILITLEKKTRLSSKGHFLEGERYLLERRTCQSKRGNCQMLIGTLFRGDKGHLSERKIKALIESKMGHFRGRLLEVVGGSVPLYPPPPPRSAYSVI